MLPGKVDGLLAKANDIAIADFNGDGRPDLFFASNTGWGSAAHRVCLQGADGSFQDSSIIQNYEGALCVAVGDVDGDGDLDLLLGGGRSAYQTSSETTVLRNDGSGGFTVVATVPVLDSRVSAAALSDVDMDGDLDAVLFEEATNTIGVHVWHNDGNGNFVDATAAALPGLTIGLYDSGILCDIDGDLDPDILMHQAYVAPRWLRNDGSGSFQEVLGWWTGNTAQLVEARDMNGDGRVDVVTGNGVHLNDGAGNMTAVGGGYAIENGVVADFDGDGLLDIAGTTDWPVAHRLWRNTGGLNFVDATNDWFPADAVQPHQVDYSFGAAAAADLDGDGDPDLVTGGVEGRSTSSTTVGVPPKLFLNTGTSFADGARSAMPHNQFNLSGIITGDFDGDGDLDVRGAGYWLSDETGTLRGTAGPSGSGGSFADFDGDGDNDLMVINSVRYASGAGISTTPSYFRNDGPGVWTDLSAQNFPPTLGSTGPAMATADVDGDGDLDALVTRSSAPIMLLVNQGDGTFVDGSSQMPSINLMANNMQMADIDGDQDFDLIATLHGFSPTYPQKLLIFTNDGAGNFTDATASLPTISVATGLLLHDLDGDQDLDIVLNGYDLSNDGLGGFASSPAANNRIADFDEDGVLDVVGGSNGIQFGGSFYPWGDSLPVLRVPVDLDGDGDLDLIAGTNDSPSGSFHLKYTGVLYNMKRDLRFTSLPRLGFPCRLSMRAGNGNQPTTAFLFAALSRLTTPVPLFDWGTLHLDPTQAVSLSATSIPDPMTAVHTTLVIPSNPSLAGLNLTTQALFVPAPGAGRIHLSAALTHALLP